MDVRAAIASDLDACVTLGGADRAHYAALLARPGTVFLIAGWGGDATGFLIAAVDGPAATVADFAVETPPLWPIAGQALLRQARARLKERGVATLTVTVGDDAGLLEGEGFAHADGGWSATV